MTNFLTALIASVFSGILFLVPACALVAMLVALSHSKWRIGVLISFPLAIGGFAIGAGLAGGFGQTQGWGFGNIAALVFGISVAGAASLMGLGIFCLSQGSKLPAALCLVFGLTLPISVVLQTKVRPWLFAREFAYWKAAFVREDFSSVQRFMKTDVSPTTKTKVHSYLYSVPFEKWTDKFADLLWEQSLIGLDYTPLPMRLATKVECTDRRFSFILANNQTTPPKILGKIARGVDFSNNRDDNLIRALIHNQLISDNDIEFLKLHLQEIETQSLDRSLKVNAQYALKAIERRKNASAMKDSRHP